MAVVNTYWGDPAEEYEEPSTEVLDNYLADLDSPLEFNADAFGDEDFWSDDNMYDAWGWNDPDSMFHQKYWRVGSGMDNAVNVGYFGHFYDGEDGNKYQMKVSWDEEKQAMKYEETDERVYRWMPSDEHKRTHRDEETHAAAAQKGGGGGYGGGFYTEAEIKSAWDAGDMKQMQEQGLDWGQYWGYVGGYNDLVDQGVVPDYASLSREEMRELNQSGEMVDLSTIPEYTALLDGLGIPLQFDNDGDIYNFNGFGYSRDYWSEKGDGLAIITAIGAIAIGAATGGALSGVFGTGFTGSFLSGAAGSAIGQGATTGKIDPKSVLISGLTAGISGYFNDLVNTAGFAGNMGEVTKTIDSMIWDVADGLGLDYSQVAGLAENITNGLVRGDSIDGILTGAFVGVGTDKLQNWMTDNFPDGFDVDNWFREGDTGISIESINGLLENGINALVEGGMSDTDAFMTMFDYFQQGGSLDFILPALGDLDLSGFDIDLGGLGDPCAEGSPLSWACGLDLGSFGDPCAEGSPISWACGLDLPDVNIPNPCPDGFIDNGDGKGCVKIPDIDIPNPCPDGFIDNGDGKGCVPNPCPEGFIDNGDGKGCVKIPDVTIPNPCPEGFIDNGDGKGCVKIPDVTIPNPCPEGFIDNGDGAGCVKIPDVTCPEGWDVDEDGVCIEPPTLCDEGYSWDPELRECIPDINLCPEGFQKDDLSGECVKIEVPCPEGWDRDEDGVCIEPPTLCGEGYSWDPQIKECVPDTKPCPEGKERNAFGVCVTPDDPCPEGYQKDENGECVEIKKPDTPEIPLPETEDGGGMFDTKWTDLQWNTPQYQGPQKAKITPYSTILNSLKRDKGMFS